MFNFYIDINLLVLVPYCLFIQTIINMSKVTCHFEIITEIRLILQQSELFHGVP